MGPTSRSEHLAWCKQRAIEYLDNGNPSDAIRSMLSDLSKHPETAHHPSIKLLANHIVAGDLYDPSLKCDVLRRWIVGFD